MLLKAYTKAKTEIFYKHFTFFNCSQSKIPPLLLSLRLIGRSIYPILILKIILREIIIKKLNKHFQFIFKMFQALHANLSIIILPPPVAERFCTRTGRREVLGSILGRACRPRRSEFSEVFSKTRLNTGQDPLEIPPWSAFLFQAQVLQADNWL